MGKNDNNKGGGVDPDVQRRAQEKLDMERREREAMKNDTIPTDIKGT